MRELQNVIECSVILCETEIFTIDESWLPWQWLLWQPAFIDRENLCFAKYHRTLDDVLQFAHVSWPRIRLKQLERLLVDAPDVLPIFSRVAIDEVFHQQSLGFHFALCKRTSRLAPDFARRVPRCRFAQL